MAISEEKVIDGKEVPAGRYRSGRREGLGVPRVADIVGTHADSDRVGGGH